MSTKAVERLLNLALFLASSREPVSAAQVRAHVGGYGADQDDASFSRMFERDKEDLRDAGLAITVSRDDDVERYRLDPGATFAEALELSPMETMQLRAAVAAMSSDPAFPFTEDLKRAMTKVLAAADRRFAPTVDVIAASFVDEDPKEQGAKTSVLMKAVIDRKFARFSYTDASGQGSSREVEPWGLYANEGRWYLVARDRRADAMRSFTVARISALEIERSRPKSPDFDRPADFDVRDFMAMPFQYGAQVATAEIVFTGAAADRSASLTAGRGMLRRRPDGAVSWTVPVADHMMLARWIIENGPGIEIVAPQEARSALAEGLERVVRAHG